MKKFVIIFILAILLALTALPSKVFAKHRNNYLPPAPTAIYSNSHLHTVPNSYYTNPNVYLYPVPYIMPVQHHTVKYNRYHLRYF